jgi:hypothetical protein
MIVESRLASIARCHTKGKIPLYLRALQGHAPITPLPPEKEAFPVEKPPLQELSIAQSAAPRRLGRCPKTPVMYGFL